MNLQIGKPQKQKGIESNANCFRDIPRSTPFCFIVLICIRHVFIRAACTLQKHNPFNRNFKFTTYGRINVFYIAIRFKFFKELFIKPFYFIINYAMFGFEFHFMNISIKYAELIRMKYFKILFMYKL